MDDREKFEKWYTAFLVKNQRVPTFYEAYMRSKPEIDALKAENERLKAELAQLKPHECLRGVLMNGTAAMKETK